MRIVIFAPAAPPDGSWWSRPWPRARRSRVSRRVITGRDRLTALAPTSRTRRRRCGGGRQ